MPGDMEIKCHSPRPTPGGLQPDTGGKELGRMEGKVSESVIFLCLKHLQEIQVEMLRRQIMLRALRGKGELSLNMYIHGAPLLGTTEHREACVRVQ